MKRFFVRYGFNQSHAIASDLSKAEASRTFGTPEHLAALVFVAFTYESALNHLGQLAFPTWDEHFDRLSPEAKLALLTDKGRGRVQTLAASSTGVLPDRASVAHVSRIRCAAKAVYALIVAINLAVPRTLIARFML